MFLLGESSCSQPPDLHYPVRFQLATRALHPFPLFSHISVVAVLVWYFHGLGALMNLFHLWSNLYFEMLDASLILWFETYSETLVHWFKKAHFLPKRLFLIQFAYISEIYEKFWCIGISTCSILLWLKTWDVAERITFCMWMLRVTALILHVFAKHNFLKIYNSIHMHDF